MSALSGAGKILLTGVLLFLPLILVGQDKSTRLVYGESMTVSCSSELLAVHVQTRTSISVSCLRDSDYPMLPTPTAEAQSAAR